MCICFLLGMEYSLKDTCQKLAGLSSAVVHWCARHFCVDFHHIEDVFWDSVGRLHGNSLCTYSHFYLFTSDRCCAGDVASPNFCDIKQTQNYCSLAGPQGLLLLPRLESSCMAQASCRVRGPVTRKRNPSATAPRNLPGCSVHQPVLQIFSPILGSWVQGQL